jgi:hypothetical protein
MISLRQAAALAVAVLSLAFTSSPIAALVATIAAILVVVVIAAAIAVIVAIYRHLQPAPPIRLPIPLRSSFNDVEMPKPLPRSPYETQILK